MTPSSFRDETLFAIFFNSWQLLLSTGIITMLLPFIAVSFDQPDPVWCLVAVCFLGLGLFMMALSMARLPGTMRGLNLFAIGFVLILGIIEFCLFAFLLYLFGF